MLKRVPDTSWLVRQWRSSWRTDRPIALADVEAWAEDLIDAKRTDAIVTPVCIEFLAGATKRDELHLARAYLQKFTIIDKGRILATDWQDAKRLAERIPTDGKPRQLGDCLIRAIARRLKHDVESLDLSFPG